MSRCNSDAELIAAAKSMGIQQRSPCNGRMQLSGHLEMRAGVLVQNQDVNPDAGKPWDLSQARLRGDHRGVGHAGFQAGARENVHKCRDAEHQQDWSSWANSARHDSRNNNMGDCNATFSALVHNWHGTRLMQQTMVHWMLATGKSKMMETVTTSYSFKLKSRFFSVWSPRSRFPGFFSSGFFH